MNVENTVVVIDSVVVTEDTGKAISAQMKASYTAEKQGILAKDKLWADGVRAEMLESGASQREQVKKYLIAGMPANIRTLAAYTREEAKQICLSEDQKDIRRKAIMRIGSQIRKYQHQLTKMAEAEAEAAKPKAAEEVVEEVVEEATEEATEAKTPNQIMAGIVEGFLNDVREAEEWDNAPNITKTGQAFIDSLSE
jgi:adenylate kinase family enzyme